MPRTETELRRTQDRLRLIVKLAEDELGEVEQELAALKNQTKLSEAFFWKNVVEIVASRNGGISSADLFRVLTEDGHKISPGALRVFLSRYKKKGFLRLGRSGPDRWELSPPVANTVAKFVVDSDT